MDRKALSQYLSGDMPVDINVDARQTDKSNTEKRSITFSLSDSHYNSLVSQVNILSSSVNHIERFLMKRYGRNITEEYFEEYADNYDFISKIICNIVEKDNDIRECIEILCISIIEAKHEISKIGNHLDDERLIVNMQVLSLVQDAYIQYLECISQYIGRSRAEKTNNKLSDIRRKSWSHWQDEANRIRDINPNLSHEAVCKKVAEKFHVTPRAVRNRIT